MHICIFNPEHDLCLAAGRRDYTPPRSAIQFAESDAGIMQVLYPDAMCFSAYDERLPRILPCCTQIHVWGWDMVVKNILQKKGAPSSLLPTDEQIGKIRTLQHRGIIADLQPDVRSAKESDQVRNIISERKQVVLKSPWSGAGRGLRWVNEELSELDCSWIMKTVRQQGVVMVEPWHDVVADMALEYYIADGVVEFIGYSLFRTGHGVYRENYSLTDDEIVKHVYELLCPNENLLENTCAEVKQWLHNNILPYYKGPVGIDLMICSDKKIRIAEMNLRHTMGMVAHARNNKR